MANLFCGIDVGEPERIKSVAAPHLNDCIAVTGKPIFSVQLHPEASPGPRDSHNLFHRFVEMMGG